MKIYKYTYMISCFDGHGSFKCTELECRECEKTIKIKVDFIVMVKQFLMMTIILIIEIYKWMLEVLPLMDIVWI